MRKYSREFYRHRKTLLESRPYCELNTERCTIIAETADHIIPKSKGGTDAMANLRPTCNRCNRLRGNNTIQRDGNVKYKLWDGVVRW